MFLKYQYYNRNIEISLGVDRLYFKHTNVHVFIFSNIFYLIEKMMHGTPYYCFIGFAPSDRNSSLKVLFRFSFELFFQVRVWPASYGWKKLTQRRRGRRGILSGLRVLCASALRLRKTSARSVHLIALGEWKSWSRTKAQSGTIGRIGRDRQAARAKGQGR